MTNSTWGSKPGYWAACLLGAFGTLAPQLLGGATEATELAILIAAVLVVSFCALSFRNVLGSLGVVPLAGLGALLAVAWTFAQAVPVPCAWTNWAQPERVEINAALTELGVLASARCT